MSYVRCRTSDPETIFRLLSLGYVAMPKHDNSPNVALYRKDDKHRTLFPYEATAE